MKKMLLPLLLATLATPAAAHNGVPHNEGLSRATIDQLHAVSEATERYRDFEVAKAEGWKKFGGDEPLMGEHWHHPDGPDYVGGDTLDFSRPSNLMYTVIDGRKTLTGVAFVVRLGAREPLPEGFAGRADTWHVHDFVRAIEAATEERPILRWLANGWLDANYRDKGDGRGRLAMAHVWVTLPNPDGVFADYNRTIPYLKLGLPAAHANGASVASAKGLDLATADGCKELIDGRLWIANAPKKTARALKATCAAEAQAVRVALAGTPAEINRAGAEAWRRFDTAWNAALTPAQQARVDAMSEHGAAGDHAGH